MTPNTVSFDMKNTKYGDSSFFLADNTPWTLSPVQQIRDIGADNSTDSVVARVGTEEKKPEKKPHSNKTNIAGKDESE